MTGHIYSLQTYGITFTRFLCLSVHTSPKYFIVSFSTSSFTSTPHILLLRPLFFPSHPAHPMSLSIFSSPGHSIYTQKAHGSLFLLSHTYRDHHHISIPLEPLTGRQPPLTINLTLAPTLPFAYFSFFG